jgi:hypothetical protein
MSNPYESPETPPAGGQIISCPACNEPVSRAATACPHCGHPLQQSTGDEAVATVVPYRNPQALIAYYLGVFSLMPCLGLVLAPFAFVLGILGLRHRRRNPQAHGLAHARIGIIIGGLSILAHAAVFVLIAMNP